MHPVGGDLLGAQLHSVRCIKAPKTILSLVGICTGTPDFECPDFDCPVFVCPDFDCAIHASVGKITVTELQLGVLLQLRSLQLRSLQILTVQILSGHHFVYRQDVLRGLFKEPIIGPLG